jgi:hypothetical protein
MDDDTFTQIIAFIAIDFLIFVFIRTSSDGQKCDFLLATRVPSQLPTRPGLAPALGQRASAHLKSMYK